LKTADLQVSKPECNSNNTDWPRSWHSVRCWSYAFIRHAEWRKRHRRRNDWWKSCHL